MTFRLSVALGGQNVEPSIANQIASILAQTWPVDEIVLSDDASTDRTAEIVEQAVAVHREVMGTAPTSLCCATTSALRVTNPVPGAQALQEEGRAVCITSGRDATELASAVRAEFDTKSAPLQQAIDARAWPERAKRHAEICQLTIGAYRAR